MRQERQIYTLQKGGLIVKIEPELGGRIMEFSLDGFNFFFVNPTLAGAKNDQPEKSWNGVWRNFGGEKIWPAPQGWGNDRQWAGPPDNVLDGGYFDVPSADQKSVSTASPVDPRTGLKIERNISLLDDESGVQIDASFENFSEKSGEWSIWPVIQVATPDPDENRYSITFPVPNGIKIMHGVVNSPQYFEEDGLCRVDYKYIIGKVGALTDGGWVAYVDKATGKAFVASCDFVDGKFPSDTNVQIWSSGRGAVFSRNVLRIAEDDRVANPPYMEIELLSPLKKIEKGERCFFTYKMRACTVETGQTVKSVNGVAVFSRELSAEKLSDGSVELSTSFGVFASGRVVLKNDKGEKLCESIDVSPSVCLSIHQKIDSSKISKSKEIILEYFNDNYTLKIGTIKL